jgi:hypothetical protein
MREPGWVLDAALTHGGDGKVFAAYLHSVSAHETGERIAWIAAGGIRLVIDELRTDVTKTRKDGSRSRLRYDYGEHRDPQAAIAWLWKYLVCRVARYAESMGVGALVGCSVIDALLTGSA